MGPKTWEGSKDCKYKDKIPFYCVLPSNGLTPTKQARFEEKGIQIMCQSSSIPKPKVPIITQGRFLDNH